MAQLNAFLFSTLNGYFEGPGRDISWHPHDAEADDYSRESLKAGNTLLFGRVTYELMARWWPTPAALQAFPLVAPGMNAAEKIVVSRTLKRAEWSGTRIVSDDLEGEVRRLRQSSERDITILGSGSILRQLAELGLIDEFQFMVDPVVLGAGTSLFTGISRNLQLNLASVRPFRNGSVLLTYHPAA